MGTVIKHCACRNDYQDAKYGKGMRVHNICGKQQEKTRCTVCGLTT